MATSGIGSRRRTRITKLVSLLVLGAALALWVGVPEAARADATLSPLAWLLRTLGLAPVIAGAGWFGFRLARRLVPDAGGNETSPAESWVLVALPALAASVGAAAAPAILGGGVAEVARIPLDALFTLPVALLLAASLWGRGTYGSLLPARRNSTGVTSQADGGPGTILSTARGVLALSAALAFGGTLWLLFLHGGAHEHAEPPFLLHWLRDGLLAFPGVAVAVGLALWAVQHALRSRNREMVPVAAILVSAGAAAVVLGAGSLVHGWLFGGDEHVHLSPFMHALRDGLLAFAAAVPIAAALVPRGLRASVRGWASESSERPVVQALRGVFPRLGAASLAAIFMLGSTGPLPAAAQTGGGDAGDLCSPGAPLKQFDIHAIDVDLPLNRFGDHDPAAKMYVLADDIDAVREQERTREVSNGLRDDPIQPLQIRANLGDCVEIDFTNDASGGDFGLRIDGLVYDVVSEDEGIVSGGVPRGETATYRFSVPEDESFEGSHYMHAGAAFHGPVAHGLFGALIAEPPGSTYLHPETREPINSGWEAIIVPGNGRPAFREGAQIWSETGTENDDIFNGDDKLPDIDPIIGAYRPGSRQINYRSEPFMHRLEGTNPEQESFGYSAFSGGDPATPIPRSYLGEPVKWRLLHGGTEIFHVLHLHGGSIRWPRDPHADPDFDYAATGLNKDPVVDSEEPLLDSQTVGPGEAYDLQLSGGAGGWQQSPGDYLVHCHIPHHYFAGMWTYARVYDTLQPDLATLPDAPTPPRPVDSAGLIGRTMPEGTRLTADNLDAWIRPQLPPQGVPQEADDASVWNWEVDTSDPEGPVYLGAPTDKGPHPNLDPDNPGLFPGDVTVGDRPKIWFNPVNGRPAFPLLRPQTGSRPPFAPNGHSGAPYLGELRGQPRAAGEASGDLIAPFEGRVDGLCLPQAERRNFNLVATEVPIQVTKEKIDPDGNIYVLAEDKEDVLAGRKAPEPIAIRANVGDCIHLTLTSEDTGKDHPGSSMHVHHVQFDITGSDGVTIGLNYEQTIRPYKNEDPRLTAPASEGSTELRLSDTAKFQPGVWIGVGLGTEDLEIRQIDDIDHAAGTLTLAAPLENDHAAGRWAGVEFSQHLWYPDILLDNVFFHTHVDTLHALGGGLVGQLLIEPRGSTYHDPETGEEIRSGTIADIHAPNPLSPGVLEESFREFVVWQVENEVAGSTFNLAAEPLKERDGDPSLRFSSWAHGDPHTPLPRAYPGDPFVIRYVDGGPDTNVFHISGHRFSIPPERRSRTLVDTILTGISERFTIILDGGAGGPQATPGDYLYLNAVGRRTEEGAWGLLRVLPGEVSDLQPLPGRPAPPAVEPPETTGARPPEAADPGNPCPPRTPVFNFAVSAVDLRGKVRDKGIEATFVPTEQAAVIEESEELPEPLVLHVLEGECLEVELTNRRDDERASFHVNELLRTPESSGINEGFNPESTVAPGETRRYRLYADTADIGSVVLEDAGGSDRPNRSGLYGIVVVAPAGSRITDPITGEPTRVGTQVDVQPPNAPGYRDFSHLFADDDPRIGQQTMPYHSDVDGPALVNYRSEPLDRRDGDPSELLSAARHGDPQTPVFRAYAGDPVKLHSLVAPGSEQIHTFHTGGLLVKPDLESPGRAPAVQPLGSFMTRDGWIVGGAGGPRLVVGDFTVGDYRRAFTEAGMWGLLRVMSDPSCPILPLEGRDCLGGPTTLADSRVEGPGSEGGGILWPIVIALGALAALGAAAAAVARRRRPAAAAASAGSGAEDHGADEGGGGDT